MKPLLNRDTFARLEQELGQLQHEIDEQLISMGMDVEKQEELLAVILSKIAVPFKVIGFAGMSRFSLVKSIGKLLSSKEDPLIT